jgi:hypothetical protein
MVIPHGKEEESYLSLPCPIIKVLLTEQFNPRLLDHGNYPLVPGTLADPFQLRVIAELVGPFLFRQVLAEYGKRFKPVFPEKEAFDLLGMNFPQGVYRVKPADRQFHCQFVTHGFPTPTGLFYRRGSWFMIKYPAGRHKAPGKT